jgi:hypothetical protein
MSRVGRGLRQQGLATWIGMSGLGILTVVGKNSSESINIQEDGTQSHYICKVSVDCCNFSVNMVKFQ